MVQVDRVPKVNSDAAKVNVLKKRMFVMVKQRARIHPTKLTAKRCHAHLER